MRSPLPETEAAGLDWIQNTVGQTITIIVGLAFVALVVVLAIAGIKYLTSGGDSKSLQAANMTVTWGLLGILFLAISWLLLQLVKQFTGLPIDVFDIKILCSPGIKGC